MSETTEAPITLRAPGAEATLYPGRGGRIGSLRVDDLELLVGEDDDPLRWGCYPMAPYAGRVREGRFAFDGRAYTLPITLPPHAIHGTSHLLPWRYEGDGVLSVALGPDWPFPGHARQTIHLEADRLCLRLEVHAEDAPFPASLGWHPWFLRELARGGPAELSFRARAMYATDASGIPTGERVDPPAGPWDDCFTEIEEAPCIRWPGALGLTLSSSADHWVVYDQPVHALCVEPMTGPPDALNIAPRIVAPGDPLVATAELCWRRL